jgi:outer membrane protein OmpA-like peptidoglycan-associated protein
MSSFLRYWCGALLLLSSASAAAQRVVGDGLNAEYYDGREFNALVVRRRDATIDFDWHGARPVAGLQAEDFSVRWTGWLVPPTTGRYVLHVSVDDGIRLWLNGRQLLDDWRGQSLSYYQLEVDLKAGEPYTLRIDYCQYAYSTRARLAWLPPATNVPASTWRTMWGMTEDKATPVVIPTRYLFSRFPTVAPPRPPAPVVSKAPLPEPPKALAPRVAAPTKAALLLAKPVVTTKPRLVSYLRAVPAPAAPAALTAPVVVPKPQAVDSGRVAALATRLASGQALTLRALYFEQGQAQLLPEVQASLDTLAQALASRPALRLEVQGHTDNQGDPAVNQLLSRQRAEAVRQYLAAHGVAPGRLRAVGYGGSRPVADNREPSQRPRNRRVVLLPLAH